MEHNPDAQNIIKHSIEEWQPYLAEDKIPLFHITKYILINNELYNYFTYIQTYQKTYSIQRFVLQQLCDCC